MGQQEIAVTGVHSQPMLQHIFVITMEKEMHVFPNSRQFTTIVAANAANTDNCISHNF